MTHTHTNMSVPSPTRSIRQTRHPQLGSPSQRCSCTRPWCSGELKRRERSQEVKVRASNCPTGKLRVRPPNLSLTHGNQSPDDNQRKVMTGRKVHVKNFHIRTAFELGPAGTAHCHYTGLDRLLGSQGI